MDQLTYDSLHPDIVLIDSALFRLGRRCTFGFYTFLPTAPVVVMSLGPMELIFIFLLVLLLFGAKRIPEIARGLGKGIREFKDATTDIKRELDVDEPTTPPRRVEAPRHEPAPRADSPAQRHPESVPTQPPPVEDSETRSQS